ncbi:MAG: PDZ domain-containing protein [Planctomycetota bacterium]
MVCVKSLKGGVFWGLLSLLGWVVIAGGVWAEEQAEAAGWFERVMDDAAYEAASAEVLAGRPGLEVLSKQHGPLLGALIKAVEAGSPGAEAGLEAGEVITWANGEWLWDTTSLKVNSDPMNVHVLGESGRLRKVALPQGATGLTLVDYVRLDKAYALSGRRGVEWDRHVYTAMVARDEPGLMEAAWFRAVAAGYPADRWAWADAAWLAYWRGRADLLDVLMREPMVNDGEAEPGTMLRASRRYALNLAAGRFDRLAALARVHRGLSEFTPDQLAGVAQRMDDAPIRDGWLSPAATVEFRVSNDLLPEAGPSEYGGWKPAPVNVSWVTSGKPFTFETRPGGSIHAMLDLPRPVDDFEFSLRFTVTPNGKEHPEWHSSLTVAIYNGDAERGWGESSPSCRPCCGWRGPRQSRTPRCFCPVWTVGTPGLNPVSIPTARPSTRCG